MLSITVRQPWAWLIIRPDITDPVHRAAAIARGEIKDIENRTWPTRVRGRVLIHAGLGMTRAEYADVEDFLAEAAPKIRLPSIKDMVRGGIIGAVDLVDCVTRSDSRWFMGSHGFVLRNPEPMPLTRWPGRLGFFDVPDQALRENGVAISRPAAAPLFA